MSAYYSENDRKAAATLRELICEGLIAPGDVDERSIEDVRPADLVGYTQCHFFAGFGIWSLAFRLAGWPDSRPVWSGSCPCQPFSQAGKGAGFADERHLWPAWFHLIQHGKRPEIPVYGEQVASPDGIAWLDLVWADLEAAAHAVWPAVLASAGFGAPIIRQRTYWVARTEGGRGRTGLRVHDAGASRRFESGNSRTIFRLDGTEQPRLEGHTGHGDGAAGRAITLGPASEAGESGGLGSPEGERRQPGQAVLGVDGARVEPAKREQGESSAGGEDAGGLGSTASGGCGERGDATREGGGGHVDGAGGASGGLAGASRTCAGRDAGAISGAQAPMCREGVAVGHFSNRPGHGGVVGGLAESADGQLSQPERRPEGRDGLGPAGAEYREPAWGGPGPTNGFWSLADWLLCRDDKWRPVEPGTFPLAHGYPERVGILRGAGNAISPWVAAEFIVASEEAVSA